MKRRQRNPLQLRGKSFSFTLPQIKRGYGLVKALYLAAQAEGFKPSKREYINLMWRLPFVDSAAKANAALEAVTWYSRKGK